ncbi:hypothetical protein SARC_02637 [Sphaeroforma arctica JP610]|uniref:Uncharacterized protein n=1 Tax=Sphaeroforma arctica JP610 TaxID=667725 RepID=A0A0L0G853_9EUKA|nr:hypothetical protein SARC_02637 [Sphaeroforma arctica JP610]KNC85180.1 hypothetical protein SARC_02637 [Sphaeroforma arctica JP610]|eukprot:XP_014159082.1 hypothetical protein SARC_02637 [Sphaeroforma arctica JP610]
MEAVKRKSCNGKREMNKNKRARLGGYEFNDDGDSNTKVEALLAPTPGAVVKKSELRSSSSGAKILFGFLGLESTLGGVKKYARYWSLLECVESDCGCSQYSSVYSAQPANQQSGVAVKVPDHPVSSSACRRCAHGPASHTLKYMIADAAHSGKTSTSSGSRTRQFRLLCELFVVVRNARSFGNVGADVKGFGWGSGWVLRRSASAHTTTKKCLSRALELCRLLQNEKDLHSAQTVIRHLQRAKNIVQNPDQAVPLPSKVKGGFGSVDFTAQARGVYVAAELDNVYWHILYSAQTNFHLLQGRSRLPAVIPPPEVYFTCLTHTPPTKEMMETISITPSIRKTLFDTMDMKFDAVTGEPAYCNTSNPLLAALQGTWIEMEICAQSRSWVGNFPLQDSPNAEKTMRGPDPLLPQPISLRCDSVRDWSARLMAFAVPNTRAYDVLSKFGTIVEVGAGVGYWKHYFDTSMASTQNDGTRTEYLAFDKDPPSSAVDSQTRSKVPAAAKSTMNEYHGHSGAWATVQVGGPESISLSSQTKAVDTGAQSKNIAVLSCYPPPYGNLALNCLKLADKLGASFVYVGEINGDTGTLQFQQTLAKSWTLSQTVALPCFSNTAFSLRVFVRRHDQADMSSLPNALLKCSTEGCRKSAVRQCRLTRERCYCSIQCYEHAILDGSHEAALVLRHQKSPGSSIDIMSDKEFRSLLEWPKVYPGSSVTGNGPTGKGRSKHKKRRKK